MGFPAGKLKELLLACARAVEEEEEEDRGAIDKMVAELGNMVSTPGEPFERLGAYMLEGLVARRRSSSDHSIHKSLKGREAVWPEYLPSYMHCLNEACPYFRLGYMSGNSAILEAAKEVPMIHIIDFGISDGTQWLSLIPRLSKREGGPPNLRITGIDDAVPPIARHSQLQSTERKLSHMAAIFGVPFQFHAVAVSSNEVEEWHLGVIPHIQPPPGGGEEEEEALAVNFNLQLHRIPDEADRDRILGMVKSLSPKLVTLVEQELDSNTAIFSQRFAEMLDYYCAVFETMDLPPPTDDSILRSLHYHTTTVDPRDERSRWIGMEQQCLKREILNLVACEGAERVERHELFTKWKARLMLAGFTPSPLRPYLNVDRLRVLLQKYSPYYLCEERDGGIYLGWKDRPLLVSSVWH